MLSKDQWFSEYEQICEAFTENGDEQEFSSGLLALGFDQSEINNQLANHFMLKMIREKDDDH